MHLKIVIIRVLKKHIKKKPTSKDSRRAGLEPSPAVPQALVSICKLPSLSCPYAIVVVVA